MEWNGYIIYPVSSIHELKETEKSKRDHMLFSNNLIFFLGVLDTCYISDSEDDATRSESEANLLLMLQMSCQGITTRMPSLRIILLGSQLIIQNINT